MSRTALSPISRIHVTTGPDCLARIRWETGRVLARHGFRGRIRELALFAVDEAASNVSEHGYANAAGRPIQIGVRQLAEGRVVISLWDRCARTYPTSEPADLRELAERRAPRGRGRALIRRLAFSVDHRERTGGGHVLELILDRNHLSLCLEEQEREAA